MKRFAAVILASLSILSFACAEPELEPRERVENLLDDFILELNHQESIYCDCWEQYDYDSRSECESWFIGPSQTRCMKDAFARDTESSRIYLECYVPLEQEYTDCVDSRLDCYDYESTDPCGHDYSVGSDECIDLPITVERDLDNCFD